MKDYEQEKLKVLEELKKVKEKKTEQEELKMLKSELNELKYGNMKKNSVKMGNFIGDGVRGIGEMLKSLSKDENRLEVTRVIDPIIKNMYKEMETHIITENHEQVIFDSVGYTKVKAKYYPKK